MKFSGKLIDFMAFFICSVKANSSLLLARDRC